MILLSTGVESAGFWHGGVEVHQLPSSQKGLTVHGWGRQAEAVHGRMLAENQAGETMSRGPRLRPLFSEGKLREKRVVVFLFGSGHPRSRYIQMLPFCSRDRSSNWIVNST